MTDAQSLLLLLVLIYLSDCVVWLRGDAVAVVVPFAGRAFARRRSAWAGNEKGGFAFTTLLPARAVFVCDPAEGGSFRFSEIDRRAAQARAATRALHRLATALFVMLFVAAPMAASLFGFARIALLLFALFLPANVIAATLFARAHRRLDARDRTYRWTHFAAMLVSTPSAVRAVDHATRHALRGFDPLAVAARLAGTDHATVRHLLRELAHPFGAAAPGPRYEAARAAGLTYVPEPPPRSAHAFAYCPRCLSQYGDVARDCNDCAIGLVPL